MCVAWVCPPFRVFSGSECVCVAKAETKWSNVSFPFVFRLFNRCQDVGSVACHVGVYVGSRFFGVHSYGFYCQPLGDIWDRYMVCLRGCGLGVDVRWGVYRTALRGFLETLTRGCVGSLVCWGVLCFGLQGLVRAGWGSRRGPGAWGKRMMRLCRTGTKGTGLTVKGVLRDCDGRGVLRCG